MKKTHLKFFAIYGIIAICIFVLLAQSLYLLKGNSAVPEGNLHFSVIMPGTDSSEYNMTELANQMSEEYDLDIELHALSTVADQKQMLRLLVLTEVDGVLLWPISANDDDYFTEISNLKDAGIPVVVVDRDVAQGVRASFVGSGTTSDLLVLNQSIRELEPGMTFMVGNQSGTGSNQIVELLRFQKAGFITDEIHLLQDKKLQQIAQAVPGGYQAVDYIRLEGENARSLMLKYELVKIFDGPDAPGLFFSLNDSLTTSAISAKKTISGSGECGVMLLCYGKLSRHEDDLRSGCLNGFVTSRPEVSCYIGIRYLRDICRGFWVPETMDSGIDFLQGTVNGENAS